MTMRDVFHPATVAFPFELSTIRVIIQLLSSPFGHTAIAPSATSEG